MTRNVSAILRVIHLIKQENFAVFTHLRGRGINSPLYIAHPHASPAFVLDLCPSLEQRSACFLVQLTPCCQVVFCN